MEKSIHQPSIRVPIVAIKDGQRTPRTDAVATEEPMEIRVVSGKDRHSLAVTMRTPGNEFELAAGFLLSEGVVREREDIQRISYCVDRGTEPQLHNIVNVFLKPGTAFDPARFLRHVYTTSSCGVCGKATLGQIRAMLPCETQRISSSCPDATILQSLPGKLREQQAVFDVTGGLHAAALFDAGGKLVLLREDVGRHNAMDKLIGTLLLKGKLPLTDAIVLVSGRASFELLQKAIMAGIPTLAAVGAPSSLAVALAKEFGLNLVGFLREGRFNLYTETSHAG